MRKFPAIAGALLGIALSATPAHAGPTVCHQNGLAKLCAYAQEVQDVTGIRYNVTQLDGPGSYEVHYVDIDNGFTSIPQPVGPLKFMETKGGHLYGTLQHCFRVILTSPSGTDLEVQPVCP
ncbi:hypothetical protein [Streptomyces cavernicola]|uniref:Secreted protein n=1 Tax=Streptomyces cavernicola TaxID=3043613 RepID=A0ABT6S798_9ACTN|nr:hypothetical protein [Streptomyces sp. B-S-A6]MDI3403981.1 hypothetical protein [Streptomyces sp. B-S-A6]